MSSPNSPPSDGHRWINTKPTQQWIQKDMAEQKEEGIMENLAGDEDADARPRHSVGRDGGSGRE